MPRYIVILPIAGYISTEVEATDEDQAISKALEHDYHHQDIAEWTWYRQYFDPTDRSCLIHEPWEAAAEQLKEVSDAPQSQ